LYAMWLSLDANFFYEKPLFVKPKWRLPFG
jgi:hypothetical protein